jgi:transcriptional regulator with XRE-family HTH domain
MSTNKKVVSKIKSYERAGKVFHELEISPSLGQLVRSLRECDEISQVDLATKLGVSRQFLSDVEHDRKVVGVDFAKKLSRAMGYPIETFLQPLIDGQLKRAGIKAKVEVVSNAS